MYNSNRINHLYIVLCSPPKVKSLSVTIYPPFTHVYLSPPSFPSCNHQTEEVGNVFGSSGILSRDDFQIEPRRKGRPWVGRRHDWGILEVSGRGCLSAVRSRVL